MNLADLHRHLDGSLRRETVAELAAARGLALPERLCFSPGMGLEAALACFQFTLALLDTPDAVERVAREMCEDAAAEGVGTLEIRFAPQLHGGDPGEILDAALRGVAGRAGLLLCGLYGESPEVLEGLVDLARSRPGVVGIDLAGGPAPNHRWGLPDYRAAFVAAGEAGLGRTVHAGEGRPPAEIRVAIEVLEAERVGHGTTLLDDPAVLNLVLERGVTIEACISSNWHVGAIPSPAAHPLPRWLARGVKACICADNTLLSGVNAADELELARTLPGMRPDLIDRAIAHGHSAAFRRRAPPTGG